jgi:FkbM family methyltransferase
MLYNVNDTVVGRSLDIYGEYSEGEIDLFRAYVRPAQVVVEVGANIGAHTVFLAKHVGSQGLVVAIEPQRLVFQTLCANLALNSIANVVCSQQASGAQAGTIHVPPLDPFSKNNFGGLALGQYQQGQAVAIVPLDAFGLQRCHFIKIDVEGMEEDVLRGAANTIARYRPILYVENDRTTKSDSLVRYIASLGYRMVWHRPLLFNPHNFFSNAEDVFANMVSFNLLCLPRDSQLQIPAGATEVLPQ